MFMRECKATSKFEFENEPALVAQVCQDILNAIGSVKEVSKETGVITGRIGGILCLGSPCAIMLHIKKRDNITVLEAEATKAIGGVWAGLSDVAQKELVKFNQAIGADKRLKPSSSMGW